MIQKTKRPISILLVLLMIVGMFSVLPISAGAVPADFSSDTKTIFVTDSQNWDSDGVLYAYYWKVETSYPAPDYNKVETVVDGDWVATKYLYDNSMNQSVYGVLIPDDANRVLFNRDDNRKTTDTSNVYDGSWWYIDENKNCVPVSGDVFDTCEQTCCLSNEFYSNTGYDRYYKLDNHYYYVSDTILDYENDLGALADQLLVAEVVGGDNNGKKFTCVNEAVAAAGEGGEVKLISDIMSNVGIDGDYTTTLDLNGHTITNISGSGITLYSKYNGDKTFTIKDTSENQTGAITIKKKYAGDGCISDSSGRKVVIEGGTYTSDGNALYVSSDNGWTIKGGTFNGNIKVVSELDVTGGTINGNINATGPSWTVDDPAEVTISGGTVNGALNSENNSTFEVSGGTFSTDVSAFTTNDTYQNASGEVVPKAANTIYDDGDFAKAAAEGGNWYIVADVNAEGVTVTSNLKVWNTDKTHTITGNFTVADGKEFAVAGRKTTNIDGDITLAGQDSKVVSTRANKVILTQPYKTGQVYGVPAATQVIYDGKEIVFDSISLTNAASKGGEFYVVDDFTMNAAVSPSKNLSLVGLKADGSRPTITVASTSSTRTAFNLFNPTNGTDLSIENINFAATMTDEKVIGVVNTNTASSADKYSTITIKNSEISGFSVADNYGAVYLHGYSHATLTNVEMSGNGKYDVWAGAAADVTISDGSYESVYLNGGVAKATVADGATITEIVAAEGTTIAADSYTNVTVGDGYKLVDNGNGSKTVVAMEYVAEVVSGNNVGTKYETVNDAVAAAGENGEVKLIADITGNVGIGGVNTPYNTTLDLNGHKITNPSGSGITLYTQSTAPATFTIKDSSPEQTGGITITKKYPGDGCISDSSGRQVIIEGGTYTSNDKALYISSDEGWTINGGTFNGKIHVLSDVAITGGTFNGEVVQSSTYDYSTPYPWTEIPAEIAISGGTFSSPVPAEFCADGYDPKDNGNGTYTVAPHEHDWDYENATWTFTENASHNIYAKYTLTCKTDPTHTKEQTSTGTLMSTVKVENGKFVYTRTTAVKVDGHTLPSPVYQRNVADGIINSYELIAATKVAGNYTLANDVTNVYGNGVSAVVLKPVDGFVLDGQNHMIKAGTINTSNYVMFEAADQNTKFTLKNVTLDGNTRMKWAVCAYTGNSGNNEGNVITLEKVTIQNFKSNDYVGAINAFGSSTWNLKNCTITGNTTVDDSDGLSGSAVWAGSKATINIDGGTYDEVYLHSYSGTGAVLNADGGATINNLVLDLTKTDTLKANIDKATVGAITANDDIIPEEAVVMDPDKAIVVAPEGYKWVDSDETGMKTLAKIVDLFAGYGLSLQGDIGLIFYLDPAAADIDIADVNSVAIDFECDHYTYHVTDFTKDGDYIKVTCYVPAAYMAHDIDAYNVKINDVALDDTDTYSVQQYAERIIDDPVGCNIPAAKANEAKKLMKEMLNYGAKAQEVFKGQMLAPADYDDLGEKYGYTMETVTAGMIENAINGTATDMSTVHPEADANFYAPSVIYLSKTTLRMVFLIPTGNGSTCPEEYSGSQAPWYYWKDVTDIPAAKLDEQQQFDINGVTFSYSVLDYAKAVVAGGSPAQKDLAASLYLYNQAANAFFTD